ncbi:hypothetical protein C8F01DRAFT_1254755 [Mycena amicta]|nr:hypothetical protein C8F01DRAFT_1254755 [Mycena amicta]
MERFDVFGGPEKPYPDRFWQPSVQPPAYSEHAQNPAPRYDIASWSISDDDSGVISRDSTPCVVAAAPTTADKRLQLVSRQPSWMDSRHVLRAVRHHFPSYSRFRPLFDVLSTTVTSLVTRHRHTSFHNSPTPPPTRFQVGSALPLRYALLYLPPPPPHLHWLFRYAHTPCLGHSRPKLASADNGASLSCGGCTLAVSAAGGRLVVFLEGLLQLALRLPTYSECTQTPVLPHDKPSGSVSESTTTQSHLPRLDAELASSLPHQRLRINTSNSSLKADFVYSYAFFAPISLPIGSFIRFSLSSTRVTSLVTSHRHTSIRNSPTPAPTGFQIRSAFPL